MNAVFHSFFQVLHFQSCWCYPPNDEQFLQQNKIISYFLLARVVNYLINVFIYPFFDHSHGSHYWRRSRSFKMSIFFFTFLFQVFCICLLFTLWLICYYPWSVCTDISIRVFHKCFIWWGFGVVSWVLLRILTDFNNDVVWSSPLTYSSRIYFFTYFDCLQGSSNQRYC